jgi:hypothetical protein
LLNDWERRWRGATGAWEEGVEAGRSSPVQDPVGARPICRRGAPDGRPGRTLGRHRRTSRRSSRPGRAPGGRAGAGRPGLTGGVPDCGILGVQQPAGGAGPVRGEPRWAAWARAADYGEGRGAGGGCRGVRGDRPETPTVSWITFGPTQARPDSNGRPAGCRRGGRPPGRSTGPQTAMDRRWAYAGGGWGEDRLQNLVRMTNSQPI